MWLWYHVMIVLFCLVASVCSVVPTVFIIMSVKTNKNIVKKCVASLIRHQSGSVRQRVIFVDDGSPKDTIFFEKQLCENQSMIFTCLKNRAKGYTHAIRYGIETALAFSTDPNDAILLLNSDVIVTHGWLFTLHQALTYDNQTMLVGPVSNAATYQSVPEVNTGKGCCHWVTNPYPPGLELDTVSAAARDAAEKLQLARVPIIVLNGFCYMFKKSLIDAIGSFDKVNFPLGYGEEVDFSIRAYKAGFKVYVVPAVYLYHAKTASFTEKSKKTLKKSANPTLQVKYAAELKIANELVQSTTSKQLSQFRHEISSVYNTPVLQLYQTIHSFSVIFLYDMKSSQSDILRTQLYQINTLHSLGMKVSIGVDNDGKSLFLRNLRCLNLDPKELLKITHFHPNTAADTEFLTSLKFTKMVESHDVIIGHSCNVVSKLVSLYPNLAKNMILYQLNDYSMQKADQFKTIYHKDERNMCMNKLTKENVYMVANTATSAKTLEATYPSLSVSSGGLSIDQNVFYMDDFTIQLRLQLLRDKVARQQQNRPKYITFFFSSASFSLHSTAEHILEVAYTLIQQTAKLLHVTVVHFGALDTATTFKTHLFSKNTPTAAMLKYMYTFLQESKKFTFFSGNDLKYGHLLRKTHVFVDMTHGHFSEQRVLEAMSCGALVITSPDTGAICKHETLQLCRLDRFETVADTLAGVVKRLDIDADNYDAIVNGGYANITQEYKLEPKAAEWAARLNKQFIAYRTNHKSTSVSIVL
jgi:GT2 family glycosyltransferase